MPYRVTRRDLAPAVTAPPPVDPALPRVAVIGAGSSGLTAAKTLHLAGIPFNCFEQGSRIGGNWVLDNPNGVSACYETLEINTSTSRMAFSDFPMPREYPAYARHDQVAAYFEQYADHFGFRDRITFDTRVVAVERTAQASRTLDEGLAAEGWRVTTEGPAGRSVGEYAAVIVANGHHWDPRWPKPSYPGDFAGEQIHAHDYRGAAQLSGRDVVVVGSGNSAMDIASVAARTARSAAISQRRGQWVIPKFTAGIPSDLIAPPGWAPWALTRLRLRIGALLGGSLAPFGLPRPHHAPSQSHPVQSEEIRDALRSGRLSPHRGIRRLAADRVHFTDGTSAPADLIVWATGYKVSFPFLDPALLAAPDNDLPLFHRAVHPDLPGLFFLGLLQPIGAVMPLAEAQASWIARILRGQYAFPPEHELRARMRRTHEKNRRRFYSSPRHTMEVDFDRFLWELRGEQRRGGRRAATRKPATRKPGTRKLGGRRPGSQRAGTVEPGAGARA